ncbi:MAG TPA: nuclear transport factor 2 family protein [Solirubrobacteraceae bacterium]|nr:nuclear transport factor 2 family protein [Solirubrobacteraceae bacterium]
MSAVSGKARSTENLRVVRQVVAAFLAGDLDAAFALADPQVEFENRRGAPGIDGTYVGREEILGMFVKLSETFEDYRTEPLQFESGGEQVAVLTREVGRGRESRLQVDQRTVALYTLADGKVSRIETFPAPSGDLRQVLGGS